MRPEFELNHLKYFYFTVLDGKVSLAADRLCVQQPVVSKTIKALEEQFGKPLFKKSGRRKVLTDFGQLVYRHCQAAFRELENLESIRKGPITLAGPLNIGATDPVAGHVLPPLLSRLIEQFEGLHPNVYTSTAHQLLQQIQARMLEFGLFFHLPSLPDGLEVVFRKSFRFRLVVSAKEKTNLKVIQSFIGSREIDDNSTHKFPTVERMRKDYPKTKIISSSNHLGLHRSMVLEGKGVSILPEFMVLDDLKKKRLVDIYPGESFHFDLKCVALKGERFSPPAQSLIQLLYTNHKKQAKT